MNVYKYRSLQNFEHVADILCNGRFYAAQFQELNDPMEGVFDFEKGTKREYLKQIGEGKKNLRICSFSRDFHNLLLWAHYADGFKGICIEVELAGWPDQDISSVNYEPYKPIFDNDQGQFAHFWPNLILREKNCAWKYEKETRVLTRNKFITSPSAEIKSVLLGVRTPPVIREVLLRIVPRGVRVWETKISNETNRVIKYQRVNPADPKTSTRF